MGRERLDKILASQNLGSRREAGKMIRAGRVAVNGGEVRLPAFQTDPAADRIAVDGRELEFKKHLYIMVNKPAGVLSASRDARARTAVDLLPRRLRRRGIFPAGRLDKDTRGLLLLTDDGAFAHRMLSPKSRVPKWYEAELESPVSPEDVLAFRRGIALGGFTCLPAELSVLRDGERPLALVALREGKFHEVKRMFLSRGNRVLSLRRVRIGALRLDPALPPGGFRELSPGEAGLVFGENGGGTVAE